MYTIPYFSVRLDRHQILLDIEANVPEHLEVHQVVLADDGRVLVTLAPGCVLILILPHGHRLLSFTESQDSLQNFGFAKSLFSQRLCLLLHARWVLVVRVSFT